MHRIIRRHYPNVEREEKEGEEGEEGGEGGSRGISLAEAVQCVVGLVESCVANIHLQYATNKARH